MHITFIISSLGRGGAEKILSAMANYLASRKWSVRVITFEAPDVTPSWQLDPRVAYCPLDLKNQSPGYSEKLRNVFHRIRILRKAISLAQGGAIISFMNPTNCLVLLAAFGMFKRVIVCERVALHRELSEAVFWQWIKYVLYLMATNIVVQTLQQRCLFPIYLKHKIAVIPNFIDLPNREYLQDLRQKNKDIVAVGRLAYQKGFDILIEAFSIICRESSEWKLTILGEGPERANLEKMVAGLQLKGKVFLPGCVNNVENYLSASRIYVLSSRYEGFPNALLEAMSMGLAVISTNCQSGPAEMIRDNTDGVLIPSNNVMAMANAIQGLISDENKLCRLGANARKAVMRYRIERIMPKWERLIIERGGQC